MMFRDEIRCEINLQKGKGLETALKRNAEETCDNALISLTESRENGCSLGKFSLSLEYEPHADNAYLAMEQAIRIYLPVEEHPEAMTAMYLFSEWWTRPAFVTGFQDIPEQTQVLFLRYPDRYVCFVPMVGQKFKARLMPGTETELCLELTAYQGGQRQVDEPLYVMAEAATLREAIHKVFGYITEYKGIRTRTERRLPEQFQYLGWCSWNACYTDVTEDIIRRKAAELVEKEVPVRWLLIDDGWMTTKDKKLFDYAPDYVKFPHGFRKMTEEIKASSSVRWFAVWHALAGYWGGVHPEGPLAAKEAAALYETANGTLLPSPKTGAQFYRDWYEQLKRDGIDYVKVDCQSAVPYYFEGSMSVAEAARGIHRALEDGASRLDGTIINCMGMAMENVLERPASAVSRNSDDFFPDREDSFKEHLLENAYNALYHNEIYNCDWDMFWTSHPDCRKHSLLRAISGGPVYFSDRIDETDSAVIKPLVYQDGRVLMMSRSAMPTEDCVFADPIKDGVLKLHNAASWGETGTAGGIAVYNLTDKAQKFAFSPAEIPELDAAERYWVYDYFAGKVTVLGREEQYEGTADKNGYFWFVILPQKGSCSCLGLMDKYVGFTAVERLIATEKKTIAVIRESGTLGWLAEQPPQQVLVNGKDVTDLVERKGKLYTLPLPEESGKTILEISF